METQNPRLLRGFSHRGGSNFTQIFSQNFSPIFAQIFTQIFTQMFTQMFTQIFNQILFGRAEWAEAGRNGPEWARNVPECSKLP